MEAEPEVYIYGHCDGFLKTTTLILGLLVVGNYSSWILIRIE